jgi:hypothetical protein
MPVLGGSVQACNQTYKKIEVVYYAPVHTCKTPILVPILDYQIWKKIEVADPPK